MEEKEDEPVGLLDAFDGFRKLIGDLKQAQSYRIPFRSSMPAVIKKLDVIAGRADSTSSVEKAKIAWQEYLATGDRVFMDSRTVRILAADSGICMKDPYLDVIEERGAIKSTQLLLNLLGGYLVNWDIESKHRLEKILQSNFVNYSGRSNRIIKLIANCSYLIGDRAFETLGSKMALERMSLGEASDWLQVPLRNTRYGRLSASAALNSAVREIVSSQNFDELLWQYISNALVGDDCIVNAKMIAIKELILGVDRYKTLQHWDIAQQFLKDYCLAHFSDPRVNQSKWVEFPKETVATFIAWLSEEDLALFFELIITDDPHHRKKFWMQYLRTIVRSRVIVSEDEYFKHRSKLGELEKKGRSFAIGVGLPSSAFLLDFGDFVAVEFSQKGNACFLYEQRAFGQIVHNFYIQKVELSNLKKPRLALHRQVHREGWTYSLSQALSHFGIYQDSQKYARR